MPVQLRARAEAKVLIGKISPALEAASPGVQAFPSRLAVELRSPVEGRFEEFIAANRAAGPVDMVVPDGHRGQSLALCGAGPSLRDFAGPEGIRGVDQIFACNSALPYLLQRGAPVTGAVGIDQTPGLLREWSDPPDVPYYVASSCDPALIQHLRSHGRRCLFFHNHVGIGTSTEDEIALYKRTWPLPMFMAGQGLTVVSRFVWVARWMGFDRIDVYGADCALGPDQVAHANGDTAGVAYTNPLLFRGVVNGREWVTRPDMLRDAVSLVRAVQALGGALRLMGDTLPVALLGKDDAFLDSVSRTILPGEPIPDPD